MKVVVTGAKGQLGTDVVHLLADRGYEVYGYGREELDITNFDQVKQIIGKVNPDVVIHAAAYTKVDLAESEPDQAFLINAYGTRNVAVVSEAVGAKLVYISTDYVFDGTATTPYNEFAPTNPLSIYGKSKLAGEQFVRDLHSKFFIFRTSWVYGKHGNNFVKTMLKLAQERDELMVVHDQVGCPTYTVDLSNCILELIQTEKYGIYHVSNSGHCSWYEFAKAIFEEAGIKVKVNPCTTKDFPRPAPRPAYSVLAHMALRMNGFRELPYWRDSLRDFLRKQ
ncbi:dTDP-4-dehydrorhamnose reductase [Anoxybacillus sp. LAT_35]|uniref:dTDP-4-dehydrorhamnose reductase n=1 Tax=unclassified Anoxybacillus TaxID=2639704 RepID=UPI001EDB0653|nr:MULTISPECIES: dTDP-4-dehydrorhamnose reductase [unclassified Anoxybacillus]MCG5026198.1 dTDP-4-dehydrorhamnose reductase [Anoxybacillus flavithermus]MCG3084236.1 dTDP-4-dehydrorhamnose reductase [Anoxybacillus sp. LAT27]MCG6172616.1 dTDP-4-dehydrorhamnose reductase [Anoxybacillus sp. LAT_11]MCG6175938.1 dTDP-4-dehydrorhamnose reductase [Anoxybacillus sp. LAT_31]MCG6178923.1 dTDP-4-dehydrorhamnose reductase [Anoxybacillus sp. LAT_35]